ncbi:MAG: hypothetical protein GVY19_14320 [Bacteroidetes bacterium]|nr:hypothetical protein [Bacteroidota bacterium]
MKINNQLFNEYSVDAQFLDEVFDKNSKPKSTYEKLIEHYYSYTLDDFKILHNFARNSFLAQGITFATYSENPRGNERIFPFDLFPRVIGHLEWQLLERGLIQRNLAINEFVKDIYFYFDKLKLLIKPLKILDFQGYRKTNFS